MGSKIVRLDGSPVGFVHGVMLRGWVVGALSNIPVLGALVGLVGLVGLVNPLMMMTTSPAPA